MKRWYYFLVAEYGESEGHWTGPEYVTDDELFDLIARTKAAHLGMSIYPFVYSYTLGTWVWDVRNDRQILAKMPIPGYVA